MRPALLDAMEWLFQPLHRMPAPGSITSQQAATGFGLRLTIVSKIARAHGGTIEVTPSPQQTCFTFRMPL
jgi:sigma-B regulation protein RsbU (phosphoserine phosphatase)